MLAGAVLVATTLFAVDAATAAPATPAGSAHVSTIWLKMAHAYTPDPAEGTTDDYHCTLLDPHVTTNSYVISSQFFPGSHEDHHAALYLVPPSLARRPNGTTRSERAGRASVRAHSRTLPSPTSRRAALSVWAPGHGADDLPKGTGLVLPAGSLVIMQVHYNLLVGDKPVKNSLVLHTVPTSTRLRPLHLDLMQAPPDIPCPPGVTGPLCNRTASLANLGQRFGQSVVDEVTGIELLCGENPSDPPVATRPPAPRPIGTSGYIVRVQAHMHLLGVSFTMVLNPGTPEAKTILDVPRLQLRLPAVLQPGHTRPCHRGEPIQITCQFDPTLAQELPSCARPRPTS